MAPTAFAASPATATLQLTSASSSVQVGQQVTISCRLSTGGQEVGAVDVAITIPSSLQYQSTSLSGGVFSTMFAPAGVSGSTLTFSAGSIEQTGYNGSGGLVATITFTALSADSAAVQFVSSSTKAYERAEPYDDILSGAQGTTVTISSPTPTPTATPTPTPATPKPTATPVPHTPTPTPYVPGPAQVGKSPATSYTPTPTPAPATPTPSTEPSASPTASAEATATATATPTMSAMDHSMMSHTPTPTPQATVQALQRQLRLRIAAALAAGGSLALVVAGSVFWVLARLK